MFTIEDLSPGKKIVVPNQGTTISYQWEVVQVLGVHDKDVRYILLNRDGSTKGRERATPIERFLDIINARIRGPHHTPRPEAD